MGNGPTRRATSADRFTFEVSSDEAGLRLDQILARRVPALSRRRARLAIELGGVFVDRARVKVLGRRVRPGQSVDVHLGGALERATASLGREARSRDALRLPRYVVVHEDEEIVVVDKPSGLLTAPTPESDRNNLADLLQRRSTPPSRLWVVHRLDLETSGLLVIAKTTHANRFLAELFRRHDVEREYLAVVEGRVPSDLGRIDAPIGGRAASSEVEAVRVFDARTLVRVRLETGRTHQARIHLERVGHPVCGDRRHGRRGTNDPPRLALHATRLGFRHPTDQRPMRFSSDWPQDLAAWLESL